METCRIVIQIKLKFSVSVGFIHNESVTMRDHTIVKYDGRIKPAEWNVLEIDGFMIRRPVIFPQGSRNVMIFIIT
jgi:hypothetical protein